MKTSENVKTNDMGIEIKCENCVDQEQPKDCEMCVQCRAKDLCHFYPVDYVMTERIYYLQRLLKSKK